MSDGTSGDDSLPEPDLVTVEEIEDATASSYCYSYIELPRRFGKDQVVRYCDAARRLFAPVAKSFDAEANSLWLLRHYLAIKLATAANLLAGSALYARDHNLLMGVPYFGYYTVLSACRAFLLTSPQVTWEGERTMRMTHSKILRRTSDLLRSFSPGSGADWLRRLEDLRERRELYSYRFPLSGPDLPGVGAFDVDETIALARLVAEVASLNSECLDGALRKHATGPFDAKPIPDHRMASVYRLAGVDVRDRDDHHRFCRMVTRIGTVMPLEVMCSDGLMDDIYGAWSDPEALPGSFDPDECHGCVLRL